MHPRTPNRSGTRGPRYGNVAATAPRRNGPPRTQREEGAMPRPRASAARFLPFLVVLGGLTALLASAPASGRQQGDCVPAAAARRATTADEPPLDGSNSNNNKKA